MKNICALVLIATRYRMVGFLVAFSLMCFSTDDKIVIVVVSVAWLILFPLLLWWISVLYEGRTFFESYKGPWLMFRRFMGSIKERIMVRKPQGKKMQSADNDTELTSCQRT